MNSKNKVRSTPAKHKKNIHAVCLSTYHSYVKVIQTTQ